VDVIESVGYSQSCPEAANKCRTMQLISEPVLRLATALKYLRDEANRIGMEPIAKKIDQIVKRLLQESSQDTGSPNDKRSSRAGHKDK
jgi:hypothetical protein